MHRNAVLVICAAFCAVAVVAGLFIANLSSGSRPITAAQTTPSAESPVPAPTTGSLAEAPTTAPLATIAPTSAPLATDVSTLAPTTAPTSAPLATDVPTLAPTSVPTTTSTVAEEFVEYTVQRGDELLQLAKKYNVSVKDILTNNQIDNPDSLVVGQVLRIPKR